MHIYVDLEGVLRAPDSHQVIPTGMLLVGTLTAYNQITFLSPETREETALWLDQNKFVDYDNIIDSSVELTDEPLGERQLKVARATGPVELFITSNPALWVSAFNLGIPSAMFGVPSYIRPEFRPDAPKKLRSWDSIESAVKAQNEQRTKDARLSRTEALNFE